MRSSDRRSGKKLTLFLVGSVTALAALYLVASGLWADARRAVTALSQQPSSAAPAWNGRSSPSSSGTGTVELKLDRPAKVYVDGHLVGQVKGGERFVLQLDAEKKHLLRFHNEALSLEKTLELEVRANDTIHADVLLH